MTLYVRPQGKGRDKMGEKNEDRERFVVIPELSRAEKDR